MHQALMWVATKHPFVHFLFGMPVAWAVGFPLQWVGLPNATVAPTAAVAMIVWWAAYVPVRLWFGKKSAPFVQAWMHVVGPIDRRDRAHVLVMRKVLLRWLNAGSPTPVEPWLSARIR